MNALFLILMLAGCNLPAVHAVRPEPLVELPVTPPTKWIKQPDGTWLSADSTKLYVPLKMPHHVLGPVDYTVHSI